MTFLTTYKTSAQSGGLLTNGYYTAQTFNSTFQFWDFMKYLAGFDLAFSGQGTELLAAIAYPANAGNEYQSNKARFWGAIGPGPRGMRPVGAPLPWRWCLNVGCTQKRGRTHHFTYHDALDRDMVDYNHRGELVLKWAPNQLDIEQNRLGLYGSHWHEWLKVGTGTDAPGEATAFYSPRFIQPVGVTIKNKARRSLALRFNSAITLQAKIVALLQNGARHGSILQLLHSEDTGNWIRADLRAATTSIMGNVVALAQAYKDANMGANNQEANGGQGLLVRYGPTGAKLAEQVQFFENKLQQDMEFLQKFPTFKDVSGDEWFTNANAQEWFKVADDWIEYVGSFGHFDFFNPSQEGLADMSRLDNY